MRNTGPVFPCGQILVREVGSLHFLKLAEKHGWTKPSVSVAHMGAAGRRQGVGGQGRGQSGPRMLVLQSHWLCDIVQVMSLLGPPFLHPGESQV